MSELKKQKPEQLNYGMIIDVQHNLAKDIDRFE